jgi:hypothetical protein
MNATVKTITAGLECDVASVDNTVKVECPRLLDCRINHITMAARSHDCRISQFPTKGRTLTVTGATDVSMGPQNKTDYGAWYGDLFFERCDGDASAENLDRVVAIMLYKNPGATLTNSTALFCKPSVNMSYSTVTFDQLGALTGVVPSTPLPLPSLLTVDQINTGVQAAIDSIPSTEGFELIGNKSRKYKLEPFMSLVLMSQNSKSTVAASDPEFLSRGASAVYRGLVTQLAKQYMMVANTSDTGMDHRSSISYNHQRLFIQNRTLRLIEAILGCVLIVLLVLVIQRNPGNLLHDTASIARFASALRHSDGLNQSLRGTGSWSIGDLKTVLQGNYCSRLETTQHDSNGKNELYVIEGSQQAKHHAASTTQQHWRPMILSWYARAAVLLIPLALIVALEIMLQNSQHSDGLLEVINLKDAQLGTALVPAMVMASTKFVFSIFDFDLRIIDPYTQLKKSAASARSTVLNQTIYTWKTDAFWIAIRNKRFIVGSSTLSVMLASFLTVAVSGLFITNPVARTSYVDVVRMDTFSNFSQVVPKVNGSTQRTARLAAYNLLDKPVGVFQSYAVPSLSLSPSSPGANITTIVVQTPVQQGRLRCELVPRDKVTVSPTGDSWIYFQWPEIMTGCTGQGKCPAAWGIYGTWAGNKTTTADINVVQCWSELQEVEASVQFSLPRWAIGTLSVRENTSKTLATGLPSHVRLQGVFNDLSSESLQTPNIEACFSSFLRGNTSNALDMHLLQRENFELLYARIQKVYGLVVAQVLTSQARNATVGLEQRSLNGTATSHTLRLQQSRVSTRILQGLLSCMFVCALVTVSTLRLTGVLPKNPCSIAALASLVAGSRMMSDIPPESQYMGDREFRTLFAGKRYTMGWSKGVDGEERFGVDESEK